MQPDVIVTLYEQVALTEAAHRNAQKSLEAYLTPELERIRRELSSFWAGHRIGHTDSVGHPLHVVPGLKKNAAHLLVREEMMPLKNYQYQFAIRLEEKGEVTIFVHCLDGDSELREETEGPVFQALADRIERTFHVELRTGRRDMLTFEPQRAVEASSPEAIAS